MMLQAAMTLRWKLRPELQNSRACSGIHSPHQTTWLDWNNFGKGCEMLFLPSRPLQLPLLNRQCHQLKRTTQAADLYWDN